MRGQLEEQCSEVSVLKEPGAGVTDRGQFERRAHREQPLLYRHRERRDQDWSSSARR